MSVEEIKYLDNMDLQRESIGWPTITYSKGGLPTVKSIRAFKKIYQVTVLG